MSAITGHDPFSVVDADVDAELALAGLADDGPARFETYLGRALLVLAVLLVLWVDVRLAASSPNYGTADEAYQVAVVQQVAEHGTPPVLGKDSFEVDPRGTLPPRTVSIRQLEPPVSGAPLVVARAPYPQLRALDRPYPYYLAVPVTWVVPWNHRIFALRMLCVVLTCLSLGFLWAAVREAWPANPLAAGMAAIVLATMGGLVTAFSVFQPEALLLALWCAAMWRVLHDWRERRCSALTVAVWTATTCVSSAALPAALVAVGLLSVRAGGARGARRQTAARLAAVLAPTVAWVAWNLHAYGDPWPLNVVVGAPARPRHWHSLTAVLTPIFEANRVIFAGLYNAGVAPLTRLDEIPPGFVAASLGIALVMALLTGRIAYARLALVRFGVLLLGSFLSIYLTLFLSSVVAGGPADYGAGRFGGYAAAWAGVVGIGFTAPLAGRRWLSVAAGAARTVALATVLLRTPVA